MCILKVYSETSSFKEFAKSSPIPVYSVFDKGEFRNKSETRKAINYTISFVASDRDWDEFPEQVKDTIIFLETNGAALEALLSTHEIKGAYLDFPIYSRLNDHIVNQNDHLPSKLVSLAGKLNLGIEMSMYANELFE